MAGADSYIITLCENHGGARQCPREEAASCCSYAITDRRIVEFLVRAVNSAGEGLRSDIFDIPVRTPVAPTGVRVTSGQATWNSVSGANSYEVALCTPQGCVVHDDIRSRSFAISDPTATYIKVRAVNSAGRGDWSRSVDVESAPPGAVRNLEFRYLDPDTSAPTSQPTLRFEITWDPPAGQAAVTEYLVTLSRPAVAGHAAWSKSHNHSSNSLQRRHTGKAGTVYTVTVAAKNQSGTGQERTVRIPTDKSESPRASEPPSFPSNLQVLHLDDNLEISWNRPYADLGSSTIQGYSLTLSHDAIASFNRRDTVGAWSRTVPLPANRHTYTLNGVRPGVTYRVSITAHNDAGTGPPATDEYDTWGGLSTPYVRLGLKGRPWYFPIDDPDARVEWGSESNGYYDIDWRYRRIETNKLEEVYRKLGNSGITEETIRELEEEAAELLNGVEYHPRLVEGDSRPRSDGGVEVRCYSRKLSRPGWFRVDWDGYCKDYWGNFNAMDPRFPHYTIHSRQEDLVLEVRVRSYGSNGQVSLWSDWYFHPQSRLTIACQALDFYRKIEDVKSKIDAAGLVLTIAGAITAAISAGASLGIVAALKIAAQTLVKKIIKNVALKELFTNVAKNLARGLLENAVISSMELVFGCLRQGLELDKPGIVDLAKETFSELKDQGHLGDVDLDDVLRNLRRMSF